MSKYGRINVHLHELKERLEELHPCHGDISTYIRHLVRAYVEDRLMILDKEILKVIDEGDYNKAVELMLPGLQKLREERMQAGQRRAAGVKKAKEDKGKKKGGVKTEKEKMIDDAYNKLMEGLL